MPIISSLLVGVNNDEKHNALVNRQTKDDKNQGTPRNYVSISTRSTVPVQCEDGGLLTHGTVEGKGDHNHHERSYKIHITKTGQLGTRDRKHMNITQITEEKYLQDQLQKHTTTNPLEDMLNNLKNNHTQAICTS